MYMFMYILHPIVVFELNLCDRKDYMYNDKNTGII
jgi:hypothetical protein